MRARDECTTTAAFLFAFVLISCAGDTGDGALLGDVDTGVIHHSVPGHTFFRPISIAVDSPFVFIADMGDNNISVLHWDLSFSHSIGESGSGPGEFTGISDIDAGGGTLVALNRSPGHISLFDYSGTFLSRFPVPFRYWGDISYDMNSIYYNRYIRDAADLVVRYTLAGDSLDAIFSPPAVRNNVVNSIRSRLRCLHGSMFIVFENIPRIASTGAVRFDRSYELDRLFPVLESVYDTQERMLQDGSRGWYMYEQQRGFDIYNDYMLIAGPQFTIIVMNITTGELGAVTMSNVYERFMTSAPPMFDDCRVKGNSLLLISTENACLVEIAIGQVMDALHSGSVISFTN